MKPADKITKQPSASGRNHSIGTLGPVADLETHLPDEWWKELFDSVYLKTDGDVVENDTNTKGEIDLLLRSTGIGADDRILDLCCGQGRHSIELAARGFRHVTGIDRSKYLIRLARSRARKRELTVTFKEGDARSPRIKEDSFDYIFMMGNSFGYFDREEDDYKVIETIKKALREKGHLILDITDGTWMMKNYEKRSWEWIDERHFVCRERTLSADGLRLITREVVTHAERGVIADQFYAERLYSKERITSLLKSFGFFDISFHTPPETQSDRNQDLGMMANRLFITAIAPQKVKRVKSAYKAPLRVSVLLGDPRQADTVKRESRFNPEDLKTVARLKEALAQLDGYQFRYLDNHETLLDDLSKQQTDLVLNYCDEGFNNDPFMELHIPSVLEILGLPYTGAGPACLGICYDKALVRAVAMANDIPVPLETYVGKEDISATIPSILPALLKPAYGDSSEGITQQAVVHTASELLVYMEGLRKSFPERPILVQEFLTGSEYSVALVGNVETELDALPVLEVDYSRLDPKLPKILGYESKWYPESPYWTDISYRKAKLAPEVHRNLIAYSSTLFEHLRCRDYARFDFRADGEGTVKLLEVNPNPGWCWDGKLSLMADFADTRYADLQRRILEAARERLDAGRKVRATAGPRAA